MPPCFINCRDRTPLQALLEWLERMRCEEIYLIDNDSKYPALLDFYKECPHKVIYLRRNVGRLSIFVVDELQRLVAGRPFIYSDPDVVPIEECPSNAVTYWAELLDRYPDAIKVGPALRIDDLPRHYAHRRRVRRWERRFWAVEVEPGVYKAPIDTTLALYRAGSTGVSGIALRTGYPYIARHLTWYIDSRKPSEEDRFYADRVAHETDESPSTSFWSGKELHPYLRWETSLTGIVRTRLALRTRVRRFFTRMRRIAG